MRILVTGNAGSGKTTLAAKIGADLDLPVFGLDSIVWQPGWQKTSASIRDELEGELVARTSWVIDGVSLRVQEAADVVIVLEVSRLTSFFRCARRNWRYLFRSRPGLPANCPEILIIPRLCLIIWRFPKHVLPKILSSLHASDGRRYRIKNSEDRAAMLRELHLLRVATD